MKQFKPLKELIRALTYIGDAIAGKTNSDTQNTSSYYDGLIEYYDGHYSVNTSEGINIKDNAFTKLGGLLSENLINDLNVVLARLPNDATFKVCTKLNDDNGNYTPYAIIAYHISSAVLNYTRYDANEDEELNLNFTTSDAVGSWTKDTILTQGQESH